MRRAWLALVLLCAGSASADEVSRRFLAAIDVVATGKPSLAAPLELRLDVPDAAAVLTALAGRHKARRDPEGTVRLTVSAYEPDPAPAAEQHKKPSFLIDFDEPAFAPARAAAVARLGEHPTPAQLSRFVGDYITTKNSVHGWDLASAVARSRTGDCTEHAALLAAMLRSFGHASRVVVGVVLLLDGKRLMAFGHAWVEVAGTGGWRALDATKPEQAPDHTYVPLLTLVNEGVSFEKDLMRVVVRLPQRILVP